MTTFKKKDLKKYKSKTNEEALDELVDTDGTMVGDKKNSDRGLANDSEIEVPDQQTSDEFAAQAIQPHRYYYGIGGTAYSHGAIHAESKMTEAEIAEAKMGDMLETLIGAKSKSGDMIKQRDVSSDVNRNGIPDIEELATVHQKHVVVKKVQEVLSTIDKNALSGEEVGIVVNHILTNIDLSRIPKDYKLLLRKNI